MAARRPRRSGYNDGQLSLDSLWAEPEPERDEQVRKARDEPLAENRPGPLRGDPGAEGDVLSAAREQAEREIQQLEDAIAGSDPPNEDYLTKVGPLNAARQAAQERVLAELILIPPRIRRSSRTRTGRPRRSSRTCWRRSSRPTRSATSSSSPAAGPAGAGPSARSRHREP
jgi:hypothetical protein